MTTLLVGNEIWRRKKEVAVDVRGMTQYRVVFDLEEEEAHILAPGIDLRLDLDEEVHPEDDFEAAAIIIVAQIEGGMHL